MTSTALPKPRPRLGTARLRELRTGLAFVGPWVIGFGLFLAYPIGMSLWYSLTDFSVLRPPVFVGTRNYEQLLRDDVFRQALGNTALYAAAAIPLATVTALVIALLLNTGVRGMPIYRTLYFIPSLVPAVATAILGLWIFNGKEGLLNNALREGGGVLGWFLIGVAATAACIRAAGLLAACPRPPAARAWAVAAGVLVAVFALLWVAGLTGFLRVTADPPAWLTRPEWVKPVLILMSVWGTGNAAVIYLAGLQDVPTHLYEAADLDGATWQQKIRHVTLPTISPVILFNAIMAIIGTFNYFAVPFVMCPNGQPARSAYFLAVNLYDNAFTYLRMGYAAAMAWVLFIIVFALTMLAMRVSRRHVHYGDTG